MQGAVYVFVQNEARTSWQFMQKLRSESIAANRQFGYSVALSESFLAVGVPFEYHGATVETV